MSNEFQCRPARTEDYRQVIDMWMSGISSDRIAIAQIANTWWKRLLFRYVAGRKIFIQDMETHVVENEQGLCGYVGLQYEENSVSVFDWGVQPEWQAGGEAAFQAMLDAILDQAYDREESDILVIGLEINNQSVRDLLADQDFVLLDYQMSQLATALPLAHTQPRGEIALALSHKPPRSYTEEIEAWIRADYADDDRISEVVIPIHRTMPVRAQIYEIKLADEPVGHVHFSSHQDEGRFLYALQPALWGQDEEKLLITAFCTQLARNLKRVRVRTFSAAHMEASRAGLETLGLQWEKAPWERWVHLLYEEDSSAVDTADDTAPETESES